MPRKKFYTDEVGRTYEIVPETKWAVCLAIVSFVYLIAVLFLLFQLLFEIWTRNYKAFPCSLEYLDSYEASMDSAMFRFLAYAMIGGAMGGCVNGIRSLLSWHCEAAGFGPRYIWKYVTFPILGAVLAFFVCALLRGGLGALGADINSSSPSTGHGLVMLGIGVLSGYGARDVFIWLDSRVRDLFAVKPTSVVPQITQQPADATVRATQTAKFTTIATGPEPLSYQWQRIPAGGPLASAVDIAGATSNEYTTPPAVIANDNQTKYLCKVTSPAGTVASNPATLTVTAA